MPFRPFSSRKKTGETRLAMSGDQLPTACTTSVSASVDMVVVPDDDTVQMSLIVLFEGTSLAGNLPYISSIAGLLLQVLSMWKEVKYYKAECKILERKLARVASIVVSVGELCEKHSLNEEDLPVGFRAILYSHLRELDGIQGVVKQCTKMKGMKMLLLRNILRAKIRQYDGELSNVLQTFQAQLSLYVCFALFAEKGKGRLTFQRNCGNTDHSWEPNVPETFSGIKSGLDDFGQSLLLLPG